jgi:Glycosyl hydrolases family 38 C-terminal domain
MQDATSRNDTDVYVIIYNALAQNRSSIVRLPVSLDVPYTIQRLEEPVVGIDDKKKESIATKREPSIVSPIMSVPLRDSDPVKPILIFDTGIIPPLGAVTFRIAQAPNISSTLLKSRDDKNVVNVIRRRRTNRNVVEVKTNTLSVRFDAKSGILRSIANNEIDANITQTWGYYPSYSSKTSSFSNVNSGAYIFRPNIPNQPLIPLHPNMNKVKFVKTSVGMEVHTTFEENWIKQVTHVTANQPYVEVEYTIGPIPIEDGVGKEIVTRLSTAINNVGVFYTDSNGREFMQRQINYRPSWNLTVIEPVAGNYYPVNAAIYIEDSDAAMAVLVDRSQGGSSLLDGTVELMVQRRTLADDARGNPNYILPVNSWIRLYPSFFE